MQFQIEQLNYHEIPPHWPVKGGSALEIHQGKIALIADDHTRFYLSEDDATSWKPIPLDPHAPTSLEKSVKYDWEAMTMLPVGHARFACLFGSGSRSPQRDVAALVSMRSHQVITMVNIQEWYQAIRVLSGLGSQHLNLEAAVVAEQALFLFNRGLKKQHHLAFKSPLKDCAQFLLENTTSIPPITVHPFQTPMVGNYASGLAAISPLSEKHQLYLAACTVEATDNTYDDGEVIGSAIALYHCHQSQWQLLHAIPLTDQHGNPLPLKIEGLTKVAKVSKKSYQCYFVTDQDAGTGHWGSFQLRLVP